MINQVITSIRNELHDVLDENQMKLLSEVLEKYLLPLESATSKSKNEKNDMLPVFISAKRVEGCSEKSLRYYESTIRNMLECIGKPECLVSIFNPVCVLEGPRCSRREIPEKVLSESIRCAYAVANQGSAGSDVSYRTSCSSS